jgi:hypothetical protein
MEPLPSYLTIESNVSGAIVYFNGTMAGMTDGGGRMKAQAIPGECLVRIEKEGYKPFETRYDLRQGGNEAIQGITLSKLETERRNDHSVRDVKPVDGEITRLSPVNRPSEVFIQREAPQVFNPPPRVQRDAVVRRVESKADVQNAGQPVDYSSPMPLPPSISEPSRVESTGSKPPMDYSSPLPPPP